MEKKQLWNEITRQIMHIILGLIIICVILLLERDLALIVLFIAFCLSILLSLFIVFFKPIARLHPLRFFLSNLSRDYDKKKFPAKGLIFFFAGCVLVLKLFSVDIALASIIILTFGDSVSTLTGLFGRAKYKAKPFGKFKTIYGTLLGIIVSFLVALIFINPVYALIASSFGMIAEAISIKLGEEEADDNFIIPLVAGTAVFLARLFGL
jgi:dolichol kinase